MRVIFIMTLGTLLEGFTETFKNEENAINRL